MRTRSPAVLVVVAVLAALSTAPGARASVRLRAPRVPRTSVVAVKEISRDTLTATTGIEPDTQVEPDVDVDPNNESHVVAVVQNGRDPTGGAQAIAYATSRDAGRTWTTGNLPGLTTATGGPFSRASDPAVAFGPDGSVYVSTLPFNAGSPSAGVAVSRSIDGGITWGQPVFAQPQTSGTDKEWIAVDTFPSSPHVGRVYIAWDAGGPVLMRHSDDHGQTWSVRITVGSGSTIGARPLVQPDGDLTIVFEKALTVVAQTSHDGGTTFEPSVTIARDMASDPRDERAGSDLPSAAVDRTNGSMYAVWGDTRFRSDGTMDAVLSRSTDGGISWTAPVAVNQDAPTDGLTHMTPAVGAYGGRVDVTFLTRLKTGTSYSNLVNLRYAQSTSGGQTFTPDVQVGQPADLTWSARAGGKFLGDYMGVASSAHIAHPVWCRSFQPQAAEQYHQTTWSAIVLPS
jgi:hypothetical protein